MNSVPSPIELPSKQFPLRLCEVLEEEFITTHGALPEPSSWLLRDCDVNFAILGDCLQGPLASTSSTPLLVIRQKIQMDGLVIPPTVPWPAATSKKLLEQLNNALKADEVLYDHNLLDPDTEAWQLAELWVNRSKAHSATPVARRKKSRSAIARGRRATGCARIESRARRAESSPPGCRLSRRRHCTRGHESPHPPVRRHR